MTREEQVDWLCRLRADLNNGVIFTPWNGEFTEALDGILEPCADAISRQAAIDACLNGWNKDYKEIVKEIRALPPVTPQYTEAEIQKMQDLESVEIQTAYEIGKEEGRSENPNKWIPVSERLPELNRPLLVTAYHRVYYGHLISESGNYGYPIFRIHGLGDKNRDWVQETMSHEPYSLGRIDAWMYFDIPEPYKASPTGAESEVQDADCD